MSAYRVGFLPLPRMVDLLIWISILFVSIFMYLEITLAISCLIISSISGEQPARSEICLLYTSNLNVHKFLAGHLGGEQQIGAQIEHNEIDLVIFLRDPLTPKSHEPDVNNVVRLCDIHNIPLATNLATAELLIKSLDRGDLEWREMYK